MPAWRTNGPGAQENSGKENFWLGPKATGRWREDKTRATQVNKEKLKPPEKQESMAWLKSWVNWEDRWRYRMEVLWVGHGLIEHPKGPCARSLSPSEVILRQNSEKEANWIRGSSLSASINAGLVEWVLMKAAGHHKLWPLHARCVLSAHGNYLFYV